MTQSDSALVIVVDDREADRELLATVLGYADFRVRTAATGEEALALTRAEHPDLLIVDLLMPGMNGYELVRRLRQEPGIAETPVMFCTANYIEGEVTNLAAAVGVSSFLPKPSEPAAMIAKVGEVLRSPVVLDVPALERTEEFERAQLRVLNDKLVEKVNELEDVNRERQRLMIQLLDAHEEERTMKAEEERLKSEFCALVSHELRTPLTSILGYLDLLAEAEASRLSDAGRGFIEVMRRNSQRLGRLLEDLMLITQIETGQFEIEYGQFEVTRLVDACAEQFHSSAERVGIELSFSVDQVPPFAGDAARIGQLLNHLVANALKFTPVGGRVDVKVRQRDQKCVIDVCDTGMGIEKKDLDHVFERLYRSPSATTGQVQGAGLGLAITKAIVDAHDGQIVAESEVGVGSMFRVALPLERAGRVEPRGVEATSGVG